MLFGSLSEFIFNLDAVVISAGMKGQKKKSDDDYDDDDWMSEFIGTSQDVDMDSITNTTQSVQQNQDYQKLKRKTIHSVNVVQERKKQIKT